MFYVHSDNFRPRVSTFHRTTYQSHITSDVLADKCIRSVRSDKRLSVLEKYYYCLPLHLPNISNATISSKKTGTTYPQNCQNGEIDGYFCCHWSCGVPVTSMDREKIQVLSPHSTAIRVRTSTLRRYGA